MHISDDSFIFKYNISQRDQSIQIKIGFDLTDASQNILGRSENAPYNTEIYWVNAKFDILDCLLSKGKLWANKI